MNPIQAAGLVAREYPGGVTALAKRLNKSPTTLWQELKPPAGGFAKLGLGTAIEITEETDDDRILFAWAVSRGYACVRLTVPRGDLPTDLLAAVSRFAKETGDALTAMHGAIADGRITENEISAFEREVSQIAPAALSLGERMRSVASQQARARAIRAPYVPKVQRGAAAVS